MGARWLMSDLREIEDLLDLCMARSQGVLSHDDWEELASLRGSVRMRRGFVGEVFAVALAGATGSGKSSILNALCGEDVAAVGVRRPTTYRSLAALPGKSTTDLGPFIQHLGVDDTVVVERLHESVIVDLPDMDSRIPGHRLAVEAALKVVDAVVWVLDPEKYADRVIHEEFLAPLSQYSDQFVFCLNKADRLGSHVSAVVDSLQRHLADDGYADPEIVTAVAASSGDRGVRIDELTEVLARRLDIKRTAQMKIAMDVRSVASHCWSELDQGIDGLAGQDREAGAVAMASFVSLGIAAHGLHHDLYQADGG
jgi:GTP-binding protein EngB required for normal cell division